MISIAEVEDYAKGSMCEKRFKHTLGVAKVARELAHIYHDDEEDAAIAALLHDVAKEISPNKKKELCMKYNIYVDDCAKRNINLTHGLIAAAIAKERFHIEKAEILEAIANHTLGRINMSKLEKIVYLADMIEPNRTTYPELEELRTLAYSDLDRAMKFALTSTVKYLKSKNKEVHPIIYSILEHYNEI